MALNPLQMREVFHLTFLRAMARSIPMSSFALKGGSNLRFYFGSIRYSEDMDIDVAGIPVHVLQEKAMDLLESPGFMDTLGTFDIDALRLPDMRRAKQTETVQRFKLGLLTTAGQDLATKVEFSRRGMDEGVRAESISPEVLAPYRLPPIIAPHYLARTAALQKVRALAARKQPQARDVFDLYLLSTRPELLGVKLENEVGESAAKIARDTIYSIGYEQYRDTVVSFLGSEDRAAYDSPQIWDEIRLTAVSLVGNSDGNG